MKLGNKKYIIGLVIGLVVLLIVLSYPLASSAFEFDTGWLANSTLSSQTDEGMAGMVITIINIILGFLALMAVILILYAGFSYMTSGGDSEKVKKAKGIILTSIIGLAIILSGYAIANYVFVALNEASGWDSSTGGSPQGSGQSPECGAAGGICEMVAGSSDCEDVRRDKYCTGQGLHCDEDWGNLGIKDCTQGTCCGEE